MSVKKSKLANNIGLALDLKEDFTQTQNISGASQQNSVVAFSWTAEVDELFCCDAPGMFNADKDCAFIFWWAVCLSDLWCRVRWRWKFRQWSNSSSLFHYVGVRLTQTLTSLFNNTVLKKIRNKKKSWTSIISIYPSRVWYQWCLQKLKTKWLVSVKKMNRLHTSLANREGLEMQRDEFLFHNRVQAGKRSVWKNAVLWNGTMCRNP